MPESFKNKNIKHKEYLNTTQNLLAPKTNTDSTPLKESNTETPIGRKVQDIYNKVYDTRNMVFFDQIGKLPTKSQSGNKYIMVMVEIDSNTILVKKLKNRKDPDLTRAYHIMMLRLKQAGIIPKKHILDNKISEAIKLVIHDEYQMEMELVPPGFHRRNVAEVEIRNTKAHFISVLAGTADDFTPSLWENILPQTETTLNLLRQSNATPNVSAYAHLCGTFDYNKTLLAPMGCAAKFHENTNKCSTWEYHRMDG